MSWRRGAVKNFKLEDMFDVDEDSHKEYSEKLLQNMSNFMDRLKSSEARAEVMKDVQASLADGDEAAQIALKEFIEREREKEEFRRIYEKHKGNLVVKKKKMRPVSSDED
jgi:hypothetical protein